jgi:hypothetical protein
MVFRPTSGHCHHVNFFIFNETENCAGGISSANVLNVKRAFFQILVADLIQPLFCGLLFPFLSLIDNVSDRTPHAYLGDGCHLRSRKANAPGSDIYPPTK